MGMVMQAFLDLVRAEPWPFIGGAIALACLAFAMVFGKGSNNGELPDFDFDGD